ncbi:SnoaL-like domain [Frankia torreyi]|uniref:SnoaL-like domain n=1 Tax=Frankia torreyi TaxID=1856 RepID=A0A0D8BJR7_9ACTN|nr:MULTISPECIES: nuclear transport factor 2 family protein [Frankia]KJE24305.1 SnoaL-like domain [Frankia torreyi]
MTAQGSTGRLLAKLVSSVPATISPADARARIAAYYASYAAGDVAGREALFSDDCLVEDPAGYVVARGAEALHRFFVEGIPPDWSVAFRLDRVAVVGNEAVATTLSVIDAGARGGLENVVTTHFVFDDAGLIRSLRTFFDADSMNDPAPNDPASNDSAPNDPRTH